MRNRDDAYDLRKIFEQIEFDLIANMQRNLKRHEAEEEEEGFKWEQWQKAKLCALREYRAQNQDIVDRKSTGISLLIEKAIRDNFAKGESLFESVFDKATPDITFPANAALYEGDGEPRENSFFGTNEKKLAALEQSVKNDLDKAQRSILRKMDDVYRKTVFKAGAFMSSGTKTLSQATDLAAKDFLAQGINCIQYKNGRLVNVASYAEMALRTASHRAVLLGEGKKRDEWGIHTVVVSAHANTCPMCEPWQGKVLIDDVFSGGTKEESDETGYPLLSIAIAAGLLHPNCRHSISTYFPGVTQLPKVPDGKEAVERYDAEQEQRKLERQIRKWKRITEGSTDDDNAAKAADKVIKYQSELRELLKKHPYLRRQSDRESTRGLPDKPRSYAPNGGNIKKEDG